MKKKILFHSNSSKALTGFGKNAKNILSYLYLTGKYEIVEISNGIQENDPKLKLMPWKTVGGIPSDPDSIQKIKTDSNFKAKALYGGLRIKDIIKEEKPDIYIGSEDIWAFSDWWNTRWWRQINTILWTTIDSVPILPAAIEGYENSDHFFTWSKFAAKEMVNNGCKQVDYLHGPVDCESFYKLHHKQKESIRESFNISSDTFIIGFVFRNQLRKTVPNLLDGFKKFKESTGVDAKLLLHTNWQEGWDIPKLLKEKSIQNKDVLTTYYCKSCRKYEIKPFASDNKEKGEKLTCPYCFSKKSQNTISIEAGLSEEQLNEIYNIMDVYCHAFTSGGQEIPIQEAKLCGLITLVTDYSCGEDCSKKDSGGLPLKWNEYREPGTQFIKASTCPDSIYNNLLKVYSMPEEEKLSMSNTAIDFVKSNYSVEKTCKKLMSVIDNCPKVKWDFDFKSLTPDLSYKMPTKCGDKEFILSIYENMLKMKISEKNKIYNFLFQKIQSGVKREKIYEALKKNAKEELALSDKKPQNLDEQIDKTSDKKRLAIVLPKSIGDIFLSTALLPELSKNYPDYDIYYVTKPEYFSILDGNEYIHKVIPYTNNFLDSLYLEGYSNRKDRKDHDGFFDICMLLNTHTQRLPNYTRNGLDKIGLEICT
jgi:hypothetical protein